MPFSRQIGTRRGFADSFSATGLPAGFQISNAGIITGTWTDPLAVRPGSYSVTVKATNDQGTGTGTLKLNLSPPTSVKQLLKGLGFLPNAAPLGETTFERSFGAGVSPNSLVAVGQSGVGNDARAFRFTLGEGISRLPMLPDAPRAYGTAVAASNDGSTIVGQASSRPDASGLSRSVAVVWRPTGAARPARRGSLTGPQTEAVSLTATDIGLFPGGIVSFATAVSGDGSAVAGFSDVSKTPLSATRFGGPRPPAWSASAGCPVEMGRPPGACPPTGPSSSARAR